MEMLRETAALGFTHAELSHGTRILLVPGVIRAVEEGVIKISSIHNFCPLPAGVDQAAPNLFEPSLPDRREYEQWLRYTKRSVDFAVQVRAKVLVMHLGSVRFLLFNPAGKLKAFVRKNPTVSVPDDKVYQEVLMKACEKLRSQMIPYWAQVNRSLEEIRVYADSRGVALGLENREKFDELPIDDDFPTLFESITKPNTCGYWHDTGHADIKQSMGMIDHRIHLERNASRLLGFHLHDVTPDGKDHQAVGSGHIDFEMISGFWRPEHLLTLELSPRVTHDEVVSSKERIEGLIAKRFCA